MNFIKCLFPLFLSIYGCLSYGQNVYSAISAKSIPLVYRGADGNYDGCGIRTVFVTDVPKPTHVADFSVNVFRQKTGLVIGFTKMIYSYTPETNNLNKMQNIPLGGYMIAKANGQALKLEPYTNGEDKNSLVAATSSISAIEFMTDISSEKKVQVGIKRKGDNNLRIFSFKSDPFNKDEFETLYACIDQMTNDRKK